MSEQNFVMYVLLLMAIAAGWGLARIKDWRSLRRPDQRNSFSKDYFVGLNYLLHDEPDEAIDTFINALELNSETLETHLALGILLRRRGKVDKAITVHQSLLGREGLGDSQKLSVRLELARDYAAAGVLDRAETFLNDIVIDNSDFKWEALSQAMMISQTSKEWAKAEISARELLVNPRYRKKHSVRAAASHFCCELAEECLKRNETVKARRWLAKGWSYDRNNVRVALMLAKIEASTGNYRKASKLLIKMSERNPPYLSELVRPLIQYMDLTGASGELETFLQDISHRYPGTTLTLEYANYIYQRGRIDEALQILLQSQRQRPTIRGLSGLTQALEENPEGLHSGSLVVIHQALAKITLTTPAYHCERCGFEAKKLHWLCPSCQHWGDIRSGAGPSGD